MADLDSAIAQLESYFKLLPQMAIDSSFVGLRLALYWLQGEIAALGNNYPAWPEQGSVMARMSPKARRWFFWAVKAGKVSGWRWVNDEGGGHPEGHYNRTGKLMASLTSDVAREPTQITGIIGFGRNYAPWVVGPKYPGESIAAFGQVKPMYQARVHEDRWFRFPDEIEKRRDELQQVFIDEFTKEFNKLANR